MAWIRIEYHPGFAEDLTSWKTEIERDGRLSQNVRVSRFMPREQRSEFHQLQLSNEAIIELEQLIDATDFDKVAAIGQGFGVDDAEEICICVEQGERLVKVSGALFWWQWDLQKESSDQLQFVDAAVRLWNAIDRLSPHRRDMN